MLIAMKLNAFVTRNIFWPRRRFLYSVEFFLLNSRDVIILDMIPMIVVFEKLCHALPEHYVFILTWALNLQNLEGPAVFILSPVWMRGAYFASKSSFAKRI